MKLLPILAILPVILAGIPGAGAQSGAVPVARPVDARTSAAAAVPADVNKKLAAGDVVSLQIVEDRDEPVTRRITDTGELDVPYIGRVRAAGKTTRQLASEIKSLLEKEYYYSATVRLGIEQVNPVAALGKVYVSGEVKAPGTQEFQLSDPPPVSAVVLRAGSFTQWADKRDVKVVRETNGRTETITINLQDVLERGRVAEDFSVRDGDRIIVGRRWVRF